MYQSLLILSMKSQARVKFYQILAQGELFIK